MHLAIIQSHNKKISFCWKKKNIYVKEKVSDVKDYSLSDVEDAWTFLQ